MAVYGPSNSEELYHWKYKYKKRINGKWRYYYDTITLDKKQYKTLDDAEKLHQEKKAYDAKSAAEKVNSKSMGILPKYTDEELARILSGKLTDAEMATIRQAALVRAYDELETAKSMSEYYAEKAKYYDSVYQEVLDQLGEETMANASIYMVNTWNGHEEFKKKYFDKLAAEEKAEALEDEYATQEEADDAAERARMAEEARAAVQAYAKEHGYDTKSKNNTTTKKSGSKTTTISTSSGNWTFIAPSKEEIDKETKRIYRELGLDYMLKKPKNKKNSK